MISICLRSVDNVWFGIAHENSRVLAISFGPTDEEVLRSLLAEIPFGVPFQTETVASPFSESVLQVVKAVYDGKNVSSTITLATEHMPKFRQRTLETTFRIPVGYVTSYGAISKVVGGSPRAVGHVMATNPFAPIIPCHRVVTSDFKLGGYGGGLKVKIDFLKREKRGYTTSKEVEAYGKKLTVFPTEIVLSKVKI